MSDLAARKATQKVHAKVRGLPRSLLNMAISIYLVISDNYYEIEYLSVFTRL